MLNYIYKCIVLVILLAATARADDIQRLSWGPIGGVSFSQLQGSELKEIQAGYAVGGFVCYRISPTLSVRPEIMYVLKGGRRSSEDGSVPGAVVTTEDLSMRIHCIDLPILTEIGLPEAGGSRPRLLVGPMLTHVLKSTFSGQSIDWGTYKSTEHSGVTEIGLTVGMSFHSDAATGVLMDLRLSWMLAALAGGDRFQDRTILALVGYRF